MSKQAAHANDTMYVCKGGTIDKSEQILGYTKNRFIVPKYFFAAIMIKINPVIKPSDSGLNTKIILPQKS